jgi:hypothetical protein
MKKKILLISFLFLVSLKSLDWFLLDIFYFRMPNQMEWDTSPWYNFLDHNKKIKFKEDEKKVLIVGSSIALYSTLPSEINDTDVKLHTELYSHVAMAPTDFYYYLDDIISHKPEIVTYVFNPGDFQLEYLEPPLEGRESADFNFQAWIDYFNWRNPARIFYPWQFIENHWLEIRRTDLYKLLGKSFLYMNRYREFFWDPFEAYIERNLRSGRSYHIYTGIIPKDGIWQSGWTNKTFKLNCNDGAKRIWKDSIYIPLANTKLEIIYGDSHEEKLFFSKIGWHNIQLDFTNQKNSEVTIKSDKVISFKIVERKPYGKDYEVGIRLSQNFCSMERKLDQAYIRPNFLDESRFSRMSLEEYKLDYFERLYKDSEKRPELLRMKKLSEQKIMLNTTEFKTWYEFNRLEEIQTRLEKHGIRFLLVMSPENPLELSKYQKGRWYFGLLERLGEQSKGHFFDFSNFFKDPRNFSDPHHLTYNASLQFSKKLKEILLMEFEQGD